MLDRMANRTTRAIELVRRVVSVSAGVLSRREVKSASMRVWTREGAAALGERALVKVLHVSTAVAKQLANAPFPAATATQRITLEAMAAQLRVAASGVLVSEERDPATLEGALSDAVEETLHLVEAALRRSSELASGDDDAIQVKQLGEADREG
jgi:hypothetical protein